MFDFCFCEILKILMVEWEEVVEGGKLWEEPHEHETK